MVLQLLGWAVKASRQRFKDPGLEALYCKLRLERWVRVDQQSVSSAGGARPSGPRPGLLFAGRQPLC